MKKITENDILECWSSHYLTYLVDILNGDYDVSAAKEDIRSLVSYPRLKS